MQETECEFSALRPYTPATVILSTTLTSRLNESEYGLLGILRRLEIRVSGDVERAAKTSSRRILCDNAALKREVLQRERNYTLCGEM